MPKPINYWSISSQVLKEEAEQLGLQVEILIPEKNLFIIRGNGKEMLFKSTDFGGNTSLGEKIANDKELSYTLLQKYNIPIPKTIYIYGNEFSEFDWTKLDAFRFPVIIKPIHESHGNGVCMHIATLRELQMKLQLSFSEYRKMIIQEQVFGDECRVLVLLDEVIIAYNRTPPAVVGNGYSTIHELIEYENKNNSLRQEDYHAPLSFIREDQELIDYIQKRGYVLSDIPSDGTELQLRGNSNIGTGGTVKDVTHILHADTKRLCIEVAKKLGLGICGVDILTTDFSKPLYETGGVILEVNGTPGIGGNRELTSINSGREILKKLFHL